LAAHGLDEFIEERLARHRFQKEGIIKQFKADCTLWHPNAAAEEIEELALEDFFISEDEVCNSAIEEFQRAEEVSLQVVPFPLVPSAPPAPAPDSPRGRLAEVAAGQLRFDLEDVKAVVTEHLLHDDEMIRGLDMEIHKATRIINMPPPEGVPHPDPVAVLELRRQLLKDRESCKKGLLRTVELLHRTSSATRPRVQVLAATQVNVNRGDTIE